MLTLYIITLATPIHCHVYSKVANGCNHKTCIQFIVANVAEKALKMYLNSGNHVPETLNKHFQISSTFLMEVSFQKEWGDVWLECILKLCMEPQMDKWNC